MPRHPSRRDVLKAGAVGAGACLGGDALVRAVLDAMADAPAAAGRLSDIEHVVILIQENRSFDHYFGTYPGVRGYDDRSVRLTPGDDGTAVFHQATPSGSGLPPQILPYRLDTTTGSITRPGVCTADVEHQWLIEHRIWDGGAMDRWVMEHVASDGAAVGVSTMGYYARADLPFYYALADAFTICDGYHCASLGGTDINRIISMSGTMDPDGFDGGATFLDTQTVPRTASFGAGGRWLAYPQVLQAKGIDWKIYSGNTVTSLLDNVLTYWTAFEDPTSEIARRAFLPTLQTLALDVAANSLPQVSWILTESVLDSEHPPEPVPFGEDAVEAVVRTLTSNPDVWRSTALFITYDENGGFFDHVPPPVAPPLTPGEYLANGTVNSSVSASTGNGRYVDPIGLGARVPLLVVSPFSRGGFVCSDVFDHTSLLRFVETRFGAEIPGYDAAARRPGLSAWRRGTVGDLTSALNFAAPDASVPDLPGPLGVLDTARITAECLISGTPVTELGVSQLNPLVTPYPPPAAQSLPRQEPLAHAVRRPSGPVGGGAGAAPAGATAARASTAGLTTTSAPDVQSMGGLVAAAGVAAAAWWGHRRRAAAVPAEGEEPVSDREV